MMTPMKAYKAFLSRFFTEIPEELLKHIVERGRRVFYDPQELSRFCDEKKLDAFSVGIFLGESKRIFEASPACIQRIGEHTPRDDRAMVEGKGEWMWLCGRDILGKSFAAGEPNQGNPVIVENAAGEVLGYGKWLVYQMTGRERNKPVIENKLDLGVYLRREMR